MTAELKEREVGKAAPALTAAQLVGEVRARYQRPEWLCEHEVTLAGRRLDVVALNLWSARSYRIVGFEVKVSRGDWLRELAAFEKSAEWHAVVDAFYVVTPGGLVKPDELPGGWGLLELRGSRMFTKVQAAARTPRAELPREVAARFLGRLADLVDAERRELRAEVRQELHAEILSTVEARATRQQSEALERAAVDARELRELREALGAGVYESHESLLAAVKLALALGPDRLIRQGQNIARGLTRSADELTRVASFVSVLLASNVVRAEVSHGG